MNVGGYHYINIKFYPQHDISRSVKSNRVKEIARFPILATGKSESHRVCITEHTEKQRTQVQQEYKRSKRAKHETDSQQHRESRRLKGCPHWMRMRHVTEWIRSVNLSNSV